jgi:Fibronectin type III domain.
MAIIKKHKYSGFLAFAIALMLLVETVTDVKIVRAETANNETPLTSQPTAEPTATPTVTATPLPRPTPKPSPTGTQKPYVKQLKKVSGVKLSRYATGQIKVTWKKNKKAKYYRVYYSQKKTGKYRLADVIKDTKCIVKRLKNNTTYYFYVQACARKKKVSASDSPVSKKVHIKTKTFQRKTIFAGDSICQGIGYPGWAYPYMSIKGKKKVIAYRGLNTITFHR